MLLFVSLLFSICSHCRAQILSAVDNYGILCLDVVWCYFWLKSIIDLPNAGILNLFNINYPAIILFDAEKTSGTCSVIALSFV